MATIPVFEEVSFSPHQFTTPFDYQGIISDDNSSGIKFYVFFPPDALETKAVFDDISEDGYVTSHLNRNRDTFYFWGEDRNNWEDTPHYFRDDTAIYLYCGDDEAIITALRGIFPIQKNSY